MRGRLTELPLASGTAGSWSQEGTKAGGDKAFSPQAALATWGAIRAVPKWMHTSSQPGQAAGCWEPPRLTGCSEKAKGKGAEAVSRLFWQSSYVHLQEVLKPAVPSMLFLGILVCDFKRLSPPQFPRKIFLYHTFAPQWKRSALESLHCCYHRMQRWTQESRSQPQPPQTSQILHPVSSEMFSSPPVNIPDSSASTQSSGAINRRIKLMPHFPFPLQPLTIYLNLNWTFEFNLNWVWIKFEF